MMLMHMAQYPYETIIQYEENRRWIHKMHCIVHNVIAIKYEDIPSEKETVVEVNLRRGEVGKLNRSSLEGLMLI